METTGLEKYAKAVEFLERCIRATNAPDVCDTWMNEVGYILNPPPTYEEVTVERWECPDCGSVYMVNNNRTEDDPCAKSETWGGCACSGGRLKEDKAIKLTGTRRVPVPRKEKKRVSVEAYVTKDDPYYLDGALMLNSEEPLMERFPETHGKTGTLTFEWPEE